MKTIELERTYLAKFLPKGLGKFLKKEIIDIYLPTNERHPVLRLRKNGDKYEMTKKEPIKEGDSSEFLEQTIKLTKKEFDSFKNIKGKKVRKIRYYYDLLGVRVEIDVFKDQLSGLVLIDFEFENSKIKNNFQAPDFCLADVTQEEFSAGGMLCGKKYSDIKKKLDKFDYKKL
jgi:CYTH domain-containing protein